ADAWLAPLGFRLASPRDAERRGSHVTLHHPHAWQVCQALIDHQVIPDYRTPDRLRLRPAPPYTPLLGRYDGPAPAPRPPPPPPPAPPPPPPLPAPRPFPRSRGPPPPSRAGGALPPGGLLAPSPPRALAVPAWGLPKPPVGTSVTVPVADKVSWSR